MSLIFHNSFYTLLTLINISMPVMFYNNIQIFCCHNKYANSLSLINLSAYNIVYSPNLPIKPLVHF